MIPSYSWEILRSPTIDNRYPIFTCDMSRYILHTHINPVLPVNLLLLPWEERNTGVERSSYSWRLLR